MIRVQRFSGRIMRNQELGPGGAPGPFVCADRVCRLSNTDHGFFKLHRN
jgi:hypothetical protein